MSEFDTVAAAWDWRQHHGGEEDRFSLQDFLDQEMILLLVNDPERESTTKRINNMILSLLGAKLRALPNANR